MATKGQKHRLQGLASLRGSFPSQGQATPCFRRTTPTAWSGPHLGPGRHCSLFRARPHLSSPPTSPRTPQASQDKARAPHAPSPALASAERTSDSWCIANLTSHLWAMGGGGPSPWHQLSLASPVP